MEAVADFLTAESALRAESRWVDAEPALYRVFPRETWAVSKSLNPFGPEAHNNLYQVECPSSFRGWLQERQVGVDRYADSVGPLQYVSAEAFLRHLFPHARANRGWRVRMMGFPAIQTVAVGLVSNYQGTQNHNAMGRASALIAEMATDLLDDELREQLWAYPPATADDWDGAGLMASPVTRIGSLDISDFADGEGALLRMVRNTTVKKELSTFFAIRGFSRQVFAEEGLQHLQVLERIASELGEPQ